MMYMRVVSTFLIFTSLLIACDTAKGNRQKNSKASFSLREGFYFLRQTVRDPRGSNRQDIDFVAIFKAKPLDTEYLVFPFASYISGLELSISENASSVWEGKISPSGLSYILTYPVGVSERPNPGTVARPYEKQFFINADFDLTHHLPMNARYGIRLTNYGKREGKVINADTINQLPGDVFIYPVSQTRADALGIAWREKVWRRKLGVSDLRDISPIREKYPRR